MITVLQDARLTEVVAQHKAQGWERMAEFMGDGLRAEQCRHRWDDYLEPRQRGLKRGNWQPDEVLHPYYCTCSNIYWHRTVLYSLSYLLTCIWQVRRLLMLVPLYTDMMRDRINWTGIGWELGRAPKDCSNKYRLIQSSQRKKGHFTAEEDALIRQRVEEWGDKGNGLWAALQKELNRTGVSISERWYKHLNRRK